MLHQNDFAGLALAELLDQLVLILRVAEALRNQNLFIIDLLKYLALEVEEPCRFI